MSKRGLYTAGPNEDIVTEEQQTPEQEKTAYESLRDMNTEIEGVLLRELVNRRVAELRALGFLSEIENGREDATVQLPNGAEKDPKKLRLMIL